MIKNYRRDIDSLRAISVLFVIFFHLKLPYFEGGYLGVDIFFVISGFLITKIILQDLDDKKFTIKNFYLRRIRRIIPLVLFVTFVSLIFAYLIFFPKEFNDFLKSIFFINLFISNIWYGSKGGYFGPVLEQDPSIHFWSLSVEEQFYLFYPILFLIFFKTKKIRNFIFLMYIIIFFSFSISQFGGNLKFNYPYIEKEFNFFSIPQFAFYSTITRAWEILIGCVAALYSHNKKRKITYQTYVINISFIFLILSLFFLKDNIPHPSLLTFIPIFFTILILIYNEDNFSKNKILNSRVFSSIGLISFSLYLWHQPVFVYAGLYNIIEQNIYYKFLLFVLIFIISFFSWRFIEKPFRNKKIINNKNLFFTIFFVIGILIISVSFFNYKNKNIDPYILKILNQSNNYEKIYFDKCTSIPKNYIKPSEACLIGDKNNKDIEFAIIGDSHAAVLAYSFDKKFTNLNKRAYLFTINGCPTSFNLYNYVNKKFHCKKYYKELKNFIDNNKNIKNIILHARWGFYISGERFNNYEGGKETGKNSVFIRNEKDFLLNKHDREQMVANEIGNFINYFSKDRKIHVITSIPEVGLEVPTTVARSIRFNKSNLLNEYTTSYDVYLKRQRIINQTFKKLEIENKISLFESSKVFCDMSASRCKYTIDRNPLYFDDDHLNKLGTDILIASFFKD